MRQDLPVNLHPTRPPWASHILQHE
jgi:hypothetical protein